MGMLQLIALKEYCIPQESLPSIGMQQPIRTPLDASRVPS